MHSEYPSPTVVLYRPSVVRPPRPRLLLLVIDPAPAAAELGRDLLDEPVDVIVTADPADGLLQAGILLPDAVLTAAQVPPMSGSAIARALHDRVRIPTFVGLEAADDEGVQRAMMAAGATACVERPYRSREILTALRSLSPDPADFAPPVEVGALRLDPGAHEVHLRGHRIDMPMREFELLHLLMCHAGQVLSRTQIQHLLWSADEVTSNTLTVHVKRLRARLGDDPTAPHIITAVRGLGYRLDAPR